MGSGTPWKALGIRVEQVTSSYVLCRGGKAQKRMNPDSQEHRGTVSRENHRVVGNRDSRWEQVTQYV
jgi:hypothetical protein